jgi:hypothetical protein
LLEEAFMGRSKEMGKPVEELTPDELRRERTRCRTLARLYGNARAKPLIKRLRQIEQRLAKGG